MKKLHKYILLFKYSNSFLCSSNFNENFMQRRNRFIAPMKRRNEKYKRKAQTKKTKNEKNNNNIFNHSFLIIKLPKNPYKSKGFFSFSVLVAACPVVKPAGFYYWGDLFRRSPSLSLGTLLDFAFASYLFINKATTYFRPKDYHQP